MEISVPKESVPFKVFSKNLLLRLKCEIWHGRTKEPKGDLTQKVQTITGKHELFPFGTSQAAGKRDSLFRSFVPHVNFQVESESKSRIRSTSQQKFRAFLRMVKTTVNISFQLVA